MAGIWLGIDGTNWVHAAWHARPGDGAARAVVDRARALISHVDPENVLACFDRRSFRHDLYAGYKGTRPEKPDGLKKALGDAEEAMLDIGAVCAVDGYEADDCLATLARLGQDARRRVVIASPDKDLRQSLAVDAVTLLRGFRVEARAIRECEWYTAQSLRDQWQLDPRQWPDFQSLVGDTGDNLPGCPAWGEKTVAAALHKMGSLAACLANPWACPCTEKQRDSLFRWRSQAATALDLVTLRTDVEAVADCLR